MSDRKNASVFALCFIGGCLAICGAVIMIEGRSMQENWKRKLENKENER